MNNGEFQLEVDVSMTSDGIKYNSDRRPRSLI